MKKIILMLTVLVQVSISFSQVVHFQVGYSGTNPYESMTLYIRSADIVGSQLEINDEIAVFDGNLCVGAVLVTQTIDPGNNATWPLLKASTDEGGGDNGFTPGNTMYFRFWDNSEGVEYYNVIPVVTDNAGDPLSNQFASTESAWISASTGNTTKTWIGDLSGGDGISWNDALNWTPEGVPEPTENVSIPSGDSPYINIGTNSANCGSLSFDEELRIASGTTITGSLIVTENISGAGTIAARRYLLANGWHLVSSCVSGQTIAGFLAANAAIPTNGASRGMMDYNEGTDNWSSFYTNATVGDVESGKGYGMRTSSNTYVTFTGSLVNGDVVVPVTLTGGSNGWNLIGNPYTSAIYARQEVFGFLTENAAEIDDSYESLYLWDPTANAGSGGYIVFNLTEGEAYLASGQGFFIKAAASGNVTFKQTMQVHKTSTAFKSAKTPWPNVVLTVKSGDLNSTTKINFNEEMSLGLDPGYDAGILRSGNGLDIYTKLVNDNGVDFTIQALPGHVSDNYVIPVGVDASKGGEIVFSAQALNLPSSYEVVLEDRLSNTLANLSNGSEQYVTEIAANTKGTGRFYLHVGSSVQTGIQNNELDDVHVYTIDQTLYIKGEVSTDARFAIYNMDGRLVQRYNANSTNLNRLDVTGYSSGVYLVNIQDKNKYKSFKFVLGE